MTDLLALAREVIECARKVLGDEPTPYSGHQDYLVIGDDVNAFIEAMRRFQAADPAGAACAIELPHRAHEFRGEWCDGQGVPHNTEAE